VHRHDGVDGRGLGVQDPAPMVAKLHKLAASVSTGTGTTAADFR
jgi:hypothetical protein